MFGDHQFVYLPTDAGQTYAISIAGTGTGTFTLTDTPITDSNRGEMQVFSEVPVTPSLKGTVSIGPVTTLALDTNGDGTVDETIDPSQSLGGADSDQFYPFLEAADNVDAAGGDSSTDASSSATVGDSYGSSTDDSSSDAASDSSGGSEDDTTAVSVTDDTDTPPAALPLQTLESPVEPSAAASAPDTMSPQAFAEQPAKHIEAAPKVQTVRYQASSIPTRSDAVDPGPRESLAATAIQSDEGAVPQHSAAVLIVLGLFTVLMLAKEYIKK